MSISDQGSPEFASMGGLLKTRTRRATAKGSSTVRACSGTTALQSISAR